MKRTISILLTLILLCGIFSGCSRSGEDSQASYSPVFESNEEIQEHFNGGFWHADMSDDNSFYRLLVFIDSTAICWDFTARDGYESHNFFEGILKSIPKTSALSEAEDVMTFLASLPTVEGIEISVEDVVFDYENDEARGVQTGSVWRAINEETIVHNGVYYSYKDTISPLDQYYNNAMQSLETARKQDKVTAFLNRYSAATGYEDVKYDPYGYLGDNFIIRGTAEPDDYFNYEYRDMEAIYFCIRTVPDGKGYYTDNWYIYAPRSQFSDLLSDLKASPGREVVFVCKTQYWDDAKNSMATLVDYYLP